ncbi:MAG: DUF3943 domain-containing protein [Muribaculaceae bacterium]|nr:DUF3943 domain-containing protein [Muribaculaceae bacterium]
MAALIFGASAASAQDIDTQVVELESTPASIQIEQIDINTVEPDFTGFEALAPLRSKGAIPSIYELPYSMTGSAPDWHAMWINTAVLSGAFVSTLFVLEMLPEGATNWNRAAIQKDPFYTRWYNHVIKEGPEWDGDSPIFNYVLHPYAGAVYFMSARSTGFNFWQSMLYAACISTIGWEFGIEACMERPSIQDIFVTPLVGSVIGELFYKLKRNIVSHDYRLWGSPVIGNIVAFLIDPVNEVIDLFRGNPARKLHLGRPQPQITSSFMPTIGRGSVGFSLSCTF